MQLQRIIRKAPWPIWVWLGLFVINWLFYLPSVSLGGVGIYPFAIVYSRLFSYPTAELVFLLLQGWLWVAIVSVISIILLFVTRRRSHRHLLWAILSIPLLAVVMFPAAGTCIPWMSLIVEPWGQTYHVAYGASEFDPDHGEGMLFECERTGILCRNIKSFPYWDGLRMSLKLQYDPKHDSLTLWRQGFSSAIYRRMRNIVLCDKTYASNSYAPVCTVNKD
jgi:hypothetical protein